TLTRCHWKAERVGFEPTVESPPHRFSRPACSTAPAPLRTAEGQSIMLFRFGAHYREGNPMKRATKSAAKSVVLENNDRISAETDLDSTSSVGYGSLPVF